MSDSLSRFAPEIIEKLEFPVISTYLVKHKLLAIEECYEDYLKPIQLGIISRTDLIWKLLAKAEKKPHQFYLALSESVNDSNDTNENHLALLDLLSSDVGEQRRPTIIRERTSKSESDSSSPSVMEKALSTQSGKKWTSTVDEDEKDEQSHQLQQKIVGLKNQLKAAKNEAKSFQEQLYLEQKQNTKSNSKSAKQKPKLRKGTVPLIALTSRQYNIKWTQLADIPDPLYAARIARLDEKLYVTGHCSPVENVRDIVYAYDMNTDQWIRLPPPGHYYGTPHIISARLCVIGGCKTGSHVRTNNIATFDEDTGKWISVHQNMNFPRSKPGVATYLEYVIVAGGAGGDSITQDIIRNDIEVFNWVENSSWRTVNTLLPFRMSCLPIGIFEGYLFIVSCYDDQKQPLSDVYKIPVANIFSPTEKVSPWRKLTNADYDTALVSELYFPMAVGGHTINSVPTKHIKMYDANAESWRTISSLLSARTCVAATAVGDSALIVIGGCSEVANTKSAVTSVELGEVELAT